MMNHVAATITVSYQYKRNPQKLRQFKSPYQLVDYACKHLFPHCMEHHEEIYAIFFNHKMRAIGYIKVGQGTINTRVVNVTHILQAALISNSTTIILVHNHPSSEVELSTEDLKLTDQIAKAGIFFGISLRDHIIISNYYSHSICQMHPHLFDRNPYHCTK